MLDLKFVRANPEVVKKALEKRGGKISLDQFLALDEERRELLAKVEEMKAKRNAASKEVGRMKKAGEDATAIMAEMRDLGDEINTLDKRVKEVEDALEDQLLRIPNIPDAAVPDGVDDSCNQELRRWGTPKEFSFPIKNHWDVGTDLDILDFERAGKIAGARFTVYKGLGARLERAVVNFFLDLHTGAHGYTEIFPPYLVNSATCRGTGQLPKFAEDMFHVQDTDFYLIPTAEVPVTNLYAGEILAEKDLPIRYAAYTACFRSEAGAAGRDTRGLIRQHQFNKVELVKFVKPEESYAELEKLTADAEDVLQKLGLPYRVMLLCGGDLGFSAARTYDLEVWLPGYGGYREISSCSNYVDFQARRANIRFRPEGGKPQFVHTLNGSGVAVGRAVAAILENYQQEDGSVKVPDVLVPYMGCEYIR